VNSGIPTGRGGFALGSMTRSLFENVHGDDGHSERRSDGVAFSHEAGSAGAPNPGAPGRARSRSPRRAAPRPHALRLRSGRSDRGVLGQPRHPRGARRAVSSQNTRARAYQWPGPPGEVGTSTQRRLVTSAPRSREVPVWQALGEGNQDSAVSIRISQGGRLFGIVALLRSGGGGPTDPLSGVDGVASEARPTSSNADSGGHPSRTG
jgi:hypothetical protein